MGFGIKELIVVLVIVILLFGTKKLKTMGSDLGSAIKGFKNSVAEDDESEAQAAVDDKAADVIDAETVKKDSV